MSEYLKFWEDNQVIHDLFAHKHSFTCWCGKHFLLKQLTLGKVLKEREKQLKLKN